MSNGKCNGEIGVPISFMDKLAPSQFEIVAADYEVAEPMQLDDGKTGTGRFYVHNDDHLHRMYSRIIIRRKKV